MGPDPVARTYDGIRAVAADGGADGWIIEVDREGAIKREIKPRFDTSCTHSDARNVRETRVGIYLVAHEKDGVVRTVQSCGGGDAIRPVQKPGPSLAYVLAAPCLNAEPPGVMPAVALRPS